MQLIRKFFKKIKPVKRNNNNFRGAVTDKGDLRERVRQAKLIIDTPLTEIILNQLEVTATDQIARTPLSKKEELTELCVKLKVIQEFRNELLVFLEIEKSLDESID